MGLIRFKNNFKRFAHNKPTDDPSQLSSFQCWCDTILGAIRISPGTSWFKKNSLMKKKYVAIESLKVVLSILVIMRFQAFDAPSEVYAFTTSTRFPLNFFREIKFLSFLVIAALKNKIKYSHESREWTLFRPKIYVQLEICLCVS